MKKRAQKSGRRVVAKTKKLLTESLKQVKGGIDTTVTVSKQIGNVK